MDPVDLLLEMVSIPSPSGGEGPLAAHLVRRMAELGLRATIDGAGNAVGEIGAGPRELVLLGHLDTVPGGPPPALRGDRLFGRGAVDAKGPLAAFALAAAAAGARPGWRVRVIGAVEEEAPSSRGARHAAARLAPAAALVGEPSGWDALTLGYKGRLAGTVEARLPTSHGAGPEPSASELVVGLWNRVAAWAEGASRGHDGAFESVQARLEAIASRLEGDEEVCRARFGFRLPPWLEPAAAIAAVDRLAGASAGPPFGRLDWGPPLAAVVEPPASPVVRAFLPAIRAAGGRPRFKLKTGTSDMNVVAPVWRCPIAAYGPGDSRLDHTPDEHVEVGELRRAVDVLTAAIRSLCPGPREGGRETTDADPPRGGGSGRRESGGRRPRRARRPPRR